MTSAAPVLLVEDSQEDFEITVGALRLANMRNPIVRCANGREVAQLLNHQGPYQCIRRPSLILLDLNLAGSDGRSLIRQFRKNDWLHSIPLTVLSTSSSPVDIELCYQAGANSYLIKPLDLDRFEVMILNLITYWFDTAVLPYGGII